MEPGNEFEREGSSRGRPLHLAEILTRSRRDLETELGLSVYGYRWQVERIDEAGERHGAVGATLTTDDPREVARRLDGEVVALDPLVGLADALGRDDDAPTAGTTDARREPGERGR